MMLLSESTLLERYVDQDLEVLEQVAESFLNQCKLLRRMLEARRLQPLQLQQTIISGIAAIEGVKNVTRPIHRVPAEVLVDIFVLLPRSLPVLERPPASTGNHWPFAIPDQRRYLELASVCRRWRDIIFNTPSFLSVVSESLPRGHTKIPDMWQVDRCPYGPLTIHIQGVVSRRMWKLLNQPVPRVRQLHINNLDPAQGEAVCKLLCSFPSSHLEHCKLHIPVPPLIRDPVRSVFSGGAARLRSLYLDRPSFLPSDTFPKLTYLTISLVNVPGEVHWSMGNLCHFLSGSPLLEDLHLYLSYLTRSLPTRHSPQLNLSRLRAFTFHLFNIRSAVTTSEVLQAFLPLVGLPPSCRRVDVGSVDIGDIGILAPYLLALEQSRTRMRLNFHVRGPTPSHGTQSYRAPDSALVFASSVQPDCGIRVLLKPLASAPPGGFPPDFLQSPLLANIEEVWVKANVLSAPLLRSILLPPKARSLALTVPDGQLQAHHLAPLMSVRAQLDTLCIVTGDSDEHERVFADVLVPLLSDLESRGRQIRRVALGYIPREPSRSLLTTTRSYPTRWAGTFWMGPIEGVDPAQDGSEMESLFRAVPELVEPPATIRSGWPVF